jgi:mannose-6-phosphate isomerase-like protein (cupin superfamily)
MKAGYVTDIERAVLESEAFRRVVYTAPQIQLVLMTLRPGEDIGMEAHSGHDQFIRVERGSGTAIVDGEEHALKDGSAVVIPSGVRHNIINRSDTESLRLYTLYAPPEHADGRVHQTKADALRGEGH